MPAAKKTLRQLVAERTFLARRHADRILDEPLDDRPDLLALQGAYQAAADDAARQSIAVSFERTVRAGAPVTTRRDEALARLQAIIDMEPEPHRPERDRAAAERAERAQLAGNAYLYGMRRDASEEARPLSIREIAERLDVSRSTVARYLDELGVKRKRRRKRKRKRRRSTST